MENKDRQHRDPLFELKECVQTENDFLITTHINPDGDSITSTLVFASLLKHIGKNYLVLLDDNIPKKFDFLPRIDEIARFEKRTYFFQPRILVVLDSSDIERIGKIREIVPSGVPIVNIDHHPSNQEFGSINVVCEKESSTVEIVYTFLAFWGVPLSQELATLIYTGVVCDTGRFRFSNTTHQSLTICAEMVKMGASPDGIARKLYSRMSQETVQALAAALSTLKFYFSGAVCCMHLSNGIFPVGNTLDTEGFVDYPMAVEKTEVGFFMLEKEPNVFRVSFRSKDCVNVNEIAQAFGGGGHTRASGCTIEGTAEEVKSRILGVLKKCM